jgi:SAM-dependent methyltransferase
VGDVVTVFKESAPRGYVTGEYLDYQKRYARQIRESDKVMIELIRGALKEDSRPGKKLSLLDIGCSSGNLLLHLKRLLPDVGYYGGDLFPEIIDHCRNSPELEGIGFEVMDIRDLGDRERFDAVVVNAVLHRFDRQEFEIAIASLSRVMCPGGRLFVFDFFHPFEQELSVVEKSKIHPEGLTLVFRPFSSVTQVLGGAGFTDVRFHPFSIPIDLERPTELNDMRTYTIRTEVGERLNFRGILFLPWCHLVARKGAAP